MTATVPRIAGPGAPRWARGVAAAGGMMGAGSLLDTYLTVTAPQVWALPVLALVVPAAIAVARHCEHRGAR